MPGSVRSVKPQSPTLQSSVVPCKQAVYHHPMLFRNVRHIRTLSLICLICTGIVTLFYFTVPDYIGLEIGAQDWLASRPSARFSQVHPDLIYLGIDSKDANLDMLWPEDLEASPTLRMMKESYPWNRAVYAAVIERLVNAGAKAVVFDILFKQPRAGDTVMREALEQYGDRVVIGSNFIDDPTQDKKYVHHQGSLQMPSEKVLASRSVGDSRVGYVNFRVDEDQKIRRILYRSNMLLGVAVGTGQGSEDLYALSAQALRKAGYENLIPPGYDATRFRYSEPILPRALHEIFVDVQWSKPPYNNGELFRDKIVLIGASGNSSEDQLQTPLGIKLGPTIHLSAINAVLNQDFIKEVPIWANVGIILLAGSVAWLLCGGIRRPFIRLILLATIIGACIVGSQALYNSAGILTALVSPLLILGTCGITWSVWEQVLDLQEKARLRKTFERYVSRDVVKELVDNPQGWLNTLGGQRKKITVLFSDVRGFTTLTEAAEDPQALFQQLNEYFDAMVDLVFANRGTLDKFIGDAVMAHWGSISSAGEQEDAILAVRTAVQMRKTLDRLNPKWKERGLLELKFGIGVNHGEAVVGNLGCEAKMEVSVIGDAVNLASRLEGVTKKYRIDFCIGEQVAVHVKDAFYLRSLDLILVQGKTKPVEIFAVIDERTPDIKEPEWLADHEEAMRLYRKGNFAAAETLWHAVRAKAPKDPITEIFLERCANLREEDPDEHWTGVYEMTSK